MEEEEEEEEEKKENDKVLYVFPRKERRLGLLIEI